jgi:energy-coupling factor transporter ATP-binding protein EcfA2
MASQWLDVLDDAIQACSTHHRPDLAHRLRERRMQLLDATLRVVVIGETGQGKSQLINALLGASVCAVGDGHTTTVPTVVEHGETPAATIVGAGGTRALEATPPQQVAPEAASAEANRQAASGTVERAHVRLPRALLSTGLVLVDSPPITPAVPHGDDAFAQLVQADAVLLASDATSELSTTELDLLGQAVQVCPTAMVVLTKIDLVPRWRRVAEGNRNRLARAGLPASVVPVSASLRLAATRTGDRGLNSESGFPELVGTLRRDWLAKAELLGRRSAGALAGLTIEQLTKPLRAEYTAVQHADTADLNARWQATSRHLEELQRDAAHWQTRLSDEVADLMSDLEFDLRDRTRRILREVDTYFDTADPARTWDEFEDWLQENLTAVAEQNFGWLLRRFDWIARKLARQVVPGQTGTLAAVLPDSTRGEHGEDLRKPTVERFGIGQKLFVGMRGSYGGLLMFGLATTVAGLPLINPISLGAGAAFGAKSVFDERGARLKRRQAAARTAAQRHVDDFFLSYGKESKDAARRIHRALRDGINGVVQRRRDELTAAARAVKEELDAESTRRARRAREIKGALDELATLRARARAMSGNTRTAVAPRALPA